MPTDMKAVILAAGQGARLRPAGLDIPKCLVEVGGKSLIEHQLSALETTGIRDVLVVVGYKGELIQRHLGDRVRYRTCDTWESSNNFLTLWGIRDELADGFVCFLLI
jgi:choline kinase